mmetsp:Transcript_106310/g.147218  ORF Transcript_106310/g.147218 Transcript_106310/m.147218 type:complete len:181 (-) Transcript_106310:119-661(-)
MIEEQNKDIESQIKRHEEIAQMNGKEKDAVKQNLTKEIEDMNDKKEKKETQIGDIESQLATIKSFVENTVNEFRGSQMKLTVAQPMQYEEETQFNENNVTLYLAELEEYISMFITYLAYKQKSSDAAISNINLEALASKDFNKQGTTGIVAPNHGEMEVQTEQATEDELHTNAKDLFRHF